MSDTKIRHRAEMIKGEISRMCVTDQQAELDWMCLCAVENIMKLRSEKRKLLWAKEKGIFSDDAPIDIDKEIEHYKKTLKLLKGIDLEEEKDDD